MQMPDLIARVCSKIRLSQPTPEAVRPPRIGMDGSRESAAVTTCLFTSDLHTSGVGNIRVPQTVDVVVMAGDVMGAGVDSDEAGRRYLEQEFFPWCRAHSDVEIVVVPGNHDKFLYRMWSRGRRIGWPRNVHYLVDRQETVRGVRFYGTPWCLKDRPGRFEGTEETNRDRFAKIPYGVDVLVSHCPPYVPGEGVDCNEDGVHEGSKELTEAILKKHPRYCICGHVHSGSRRTVWIGRTEVKNVARVKEDRGTAEVSPTIIGIWHGRGAAKQSAQNKEKGVFSA